jgi:hypothetical protein
MPSYTSPTPCLHPTQERKVGVAASTATILNTAYLFEFHVSLFPHGTVAAASCMHSSTSQRAPSSTSTLSTPLGARSHCPNRQVPGEASWRNGAKAGCTYLRSESIFLAPVPCLRGWDSGSVLFLGKFIAAKSYYATFHRFVSILSYLVIVLLYQHSQMRFDLYTGTPNQSMTRGEN